MPESTPVPISLSSFGAPPVRCDLLAVTRHELEPHCGIARSLA
jgi:hypothetical protein